MVTIEFWVTQAFNGISYGALLFLLASGLSLIFGAMGLAVADRVHVISRGRVVHSSVPAELLANEEVKSRYLGVS